MVTMNEQVFLFLTCIQTGIAMGMIYDLMRILRKLIHHPNWMVQIEDLLYWIACGGFAFIMLYWENYGQIRGFVFIGILIGGVLYFLTVSILFMKIARWIVFWIKKVMKRLIDFVFIPIKCIIRVIRIPYQFFCNTYDKIKRCRKIKKHQAKIKRKRRRDQLRAQWRIVREKK